MISGTLAWRKKDFLSEKGVFVADGGGGWGPVGSISRFPVVILFYYACRIFASVGKWIKVWISVDNRW